MPEETSYAKEAEDDAREMVDHYLDEIVEKILEEGEASEDLYNDYTQGDSYHHERHVDRSYSLLEAAQLLDQLYNHEETDSGLWEGQAPREAVATQAAYTYGNAVYSEWENFIQEINEEVGTLKEELEEERKFKIENVEARLDNPNLAEAEREKLESELEDLKNDDAFQEFLEKKIRRAVQVTVGLKKRQRGGPKEWEPD